MSYQQCKTKQQRIDYIRRQIAGNDGWMLKGLLTIYSYQTLSEQATGTTKENNNVGFNGADAEILSSFAQQFKNRGSLSPKQMEIARKKMVKYARQLESIASAKAVAQQHKLEMNNDQ